MNDYLEGTQIKEQAHYQTCTKEKTRTLTTLYHLIQGSQTRGPRAASGPPDVFVRPATSLKLLKLLIKLRFFLYKGTFSLQLWPAETFFLLMRPASPFLLKCGPRMKLSLRRLI